MLSVGLPYPKRDGTLNLSNSCVRVCIRRLMVTTMKTGDVEVAESRQQGSEFNVIGWPHRLDPQRYAAPSFAPFKDRRWALGCERDAESEPSQFDSVYRHRRPKVGRTQYRSESVDEAQAGSNRSQRTSGITVSQPGERNSVIGVGACREVSYSRCHHDVTQLSRSEAPISSGDRYAGDIGTDVARFVLPVVGGEAIGEASRLLQQR